MNRACITCIHTQEPHMREHACKEHLVTEGLSTLPTSWMQARVPAANVRGAASCFELDVPEQDFDEHADKGSRSKI